MSRSTWYWILPDSLFHLASHPSRTHYRQIAECNQCNFWHSSLAFKVWIVWAIPYTVPYCMLVYKMSQIVNFIMTSSLLAYTDYATQHTQITSIATNSLKCSILAEIKSRTQKIQMQMEKCAFSVHCLYVLRSICYWLFSTKFYQVYFVGLYVMDNSNLMNHSLMAISLMSHCVDFWLLSKSQARR